MALSLTAETLLLAIDPGKGGLLVRGSSLRTALRAASEVEGPRRRDQATMQAARRELVEAGLIERSGLLRRLRLAGHNPASTRLHAIKQGSATGRFASDRDRQLFLVLAACGVLTRRWTREEIRVARRELASLISDPDDSTRTLTLNLTRDAPFQAPGFGAMEDVPGPELPRRPRRGPLTQAMGGEGGASNRFDRDGDSENRS